MRPVRPRERHVPLACAYPEDRNLPRQNRTSRCQVAWGTCSREGGTWMLTQLITEGTCNQQNGKRAPPFLGEMDTEYEYDTNHHKTTRPLLSRRHVPLILLRSEVMVWWPGVCSLKHGTNVLLQRSGPVNRLLRLVVFTVIHSTQQEFTVSTTVSRKWKVHGRRTGGRLFGKERERHTDHISFAGRGKRNAQITFSCTQCAHTHTHTHTHTRARLARARRENVSSSHSLALHSHPLVDQSRLTTLFTTQPPFFGILRLHNRISFEL